MESTGVVNLPISKEYVLFLPFCPQRTESPLCFLESEMSHMENKCLEESSGEFFVSDVCDALEVKQWLGSKPDRGMRQFHKEFFSPSCACP